MLKRLEIDGSMTITLRIGQHQRMPLDPWHLPSRIAKRCFRRKSAGRRIMSPLMVFTAGNGSWKNGSSVEYVGHAGTDDNHSRRTGEQRDRIFRAGR